MNWNKVSAIAEIVSSAAILVTLVYLAVQTQQLATQTQQNTAAMISNSRQQSLDAELQVFRLIADYPVAGFARPDARPVDSDLTRQQMSAFMLFRIREHQWLQYQAGRLDASTWQAYTKVLVNTLNDNEIVRRFWAPETLDSSFVDYIDERLRDTGEQPANE